MSYYIPPKVWSAEESNQGKFSAINRPTAGSRFDQKLPQGDKPLQVYSLGTPCWRRFRSLFQLCS